MAEGGDVETKLDLVVRVLTEGMDKLNETADKVDETADKISGSSEQAEGHMDSLSESMGEAEDGADGAADAFANLTGQGLALLFAGRFLSQTFGSMSRTMMQFMGMSDILSSTMKAVLTPAFTALIPIVSKVSEFFLSLSEDTKRMIGFFVMIMAALAPILALVGQVVAMAAAFGAVSVTLGAVATAAGVVAGAIAILWAGFEYGLNLGHKLMDAFANFKDVIDSVIKFFQAAVRGQWSKAWGYLWDAAKSGVDGVMNLINGLLFNIPKTLKKLAAKVLTKAVKIGKNIVNGIKNFIQDNSDLITDAFNAILPFGLTLEKIGNAIGTLSGGGGAGDGHRTARGNDFVLSGGKMIRTHPNDVLMGVKKGNLGRGSGGGGQNITINIDRPELHDEMDVDKLVDRVERRVSRNTSGRSNLR